MTWATARDQMITVVEAITGLSTARGLVPTLKHISEGDRDADLALDTRSFFFELVEASNRQLLRVAGATWTSAVVDLVVVYRDDVNPTALVEAQLSDHRAISLALLNDANWGRPTSTITKLGGGDEALTARVERVPGGSVMSIRIPIDFT